MPLSYEDARAELYRAALDEFVAARKRLASELTRAGDKPGAARFKKLARPSLSAWAVNQLWWHARETFEEFLSSAARLRAGELAATSSHRDLLAKLRGRAAQLLTEGGHAASEATLRRVSATLSALSAAGGFEPDAPGALTADRDPPGFDAWGETGLLGVAREPAHQVPEPRRIADNEDRSESQDPTGQQQESERAELERVARQRLERERLELVERERVERERLELLERERVERERRRAQRGRLEQQLSAVQREAETQQLRQQQLRAELDQTNQALAASRALITELERSLAELGSEEPEATSSR